MSPEELLRALTEARIELSEVRKTRDEAQELLIEANESLTEALEKLLEVRQERDAADAALLEVRQERDAVEAAIKVLEKELREDLKEADAAIKVLENELSEAAELERKEIRHRLREVQALFVHVVKHDELDPLNAVFDYVIEDESFLQMQIAIGLFR